MKRRSFLTTVASAGLFAAAPASLLRAEAGVSSAAVVLTGITADTPSAPLIEIAGALLDRGIWITCGVSLPETEADDPALAATLAGLLGLGGGLDFALDLPGLSSVSPYFQARAVFDAGTRLRRLLGAHTPSSLFATVLCDEVESPTAPVGVRASGVRNVLVRPTATSPVSSESWDGGVVRFFGGLRVDPAAGTVFDGQDLGAENALLFYLPADTATALPDDQRRRWSSGFAKALMERELMGQLAMMTVPDMQLRDNFEQKRLVAVVLELSPDATQAEQDGVAAFRRRLADRNIPTTIKPHGRDFWVDGSGEEARLVPVSLLCTEPGPSGIEAAAPLAPGFTLSFARAGEDDFGLDGCASLHVPTVEVDPEIPTQDLVRQLAGQSDLVLLLSAARIASAEAQLRVVADLQALPQDAVTRYVGIEALAAMLHTDEPTVVRHRLTRAAIANAAFAPALRLGESERARLLDDARQAWRYFESYTDRATGLCPATVETRAGGDSQQSVTMWDVGSNFNAIVAAVEIGLITRDDALARIRRILPNIAGRSTDGRLLPQGWIRTDRARWGNRNFDGCDAGRLLASLDHARRRLELGDLFDATVEAWDLEKIILGREIQSVTDGELSTTYTSHCAHYAALAFRRWGLDAASPYETFATRAPGDGEMALLETVAQIGPMGTEPLLLEAMELGMSQEARYLADTLHAALEEEFEDTGRLLCVSETPIDRVPWFIYQGLELGSGPRSWRLDTVGHQSEYLTEEAATEYMTFSTKAAFLWAAYRPGAFTRRLLDFAREKTSGSSAGFASGVNIGTQQVMTGYSDLNTNGIILEAVAHMLGDPG